MQEKLTKLSLLPTFKTIAEDVANKRRIRLQEITKCVKHLYHELSEHAHGNDTIITIRAHDYTPGEVATLVAYFSLQDTWCNAISWDLEEAKRKDEDKGEDEERGKTRTRGEDEHSGR